MILVLIFVTKISFAQEESNKERLETAKKIVQFIEKKDYTSIKEMFPDSISKDIPENALKYYVDLGSQFINEFGIPNDESLTTKVNIVPTKTETVLLNSIVFPFPATKDKYTMSKKIIEVGFIEKYGNKKIMSLRVYELQPPPIESKIKYLDKLVFGADSISNWRIYYSKGNIQNQNRDVFAIRGNQEKMESLRIEKDIKSIFSELSNAPIKDKSYPNDIIRFNGNPESISFTWQYKGNNTFYRIQIIINKENDIDEPLNDFVIVSTSQFANQPTVYYVEKNKVKKIIEVLTKFSKKDWRNEYEERP